MSGMTVDCAVRYLHPSQLVDHQLLLAIDQSPQVSPHFFTGRLARPRRTASMLRGLMNIVRSRFHIPAAMLGRILAESDPVVTCSDDRLRFEGFSACCGAYARVDLMPAAVQGQTFGRGTTNVDFNQPMLTALAKIKDSDQVWLNVGTDRVELTRNADTVVEKQVALPMRWLKGFLEVQACQSRMILVHEVNGREALRFFRGLPRMKTNRRETYVVEAGQGLRLSQIAARQAVRVGGLERLRVLEELASDARQLHVYADETTGASAWVLSFDDSRFCLVLSPEVWRGFSGEGQGLASLASAQRDKLLPLVRSAISGQAVIDEEALQRQVSAQLRGFEVTASTVRAALAALGTQGLVGFDLLEGCWYHRELPFNLDAVDKQHPRLKDARKLLADNLVRIGNRTSQQIEVLVQSGDIEHRVRVTAEEARCTCPWFAKHGTARGPCKHILASHIMLESLEDESEDYQKR